MVRPWIGPANFIFYFYFLFYFYRCFKEYFSLITLEISQENFHNFIINLQVKGNAQFVKKVTFEPLIDFKQNHYAKWKCYKNCYF